MIDAMSQGQAIDPGQYVVVIEVRANRVLVRPAMGDERPGRSAATDDPLSRSIEELGIESLDDPLGRENGPLWAKRSARFGPGAVLSFCERAEDKSAWIAGNLGFCWAKSCAS